MSKFKSTCWLIAVAGCCFGLVDRLTQSDSYSMLIAGGFTLLIIPLAPWLK
jgi:hypothetical protein